MEFLLLAAISLDLFFVCLSYSIRKIKIPAASITVLSGISTLYLAASAAAGLFLRHLLSGSIFTYFGFALLLCMGCLNLLDEPIQNACRSLKTRKIHLRLAKVNLVLEIYMDKTKADQDNSKSLTPSEAVFLALPLSLDCFVTGLSICFTRQTLPIYLPYMFLITVLFCSLGIFLGTKLQKLPGKFNSSILSGIILIALAFCRLK